MNFSHLYSWLKFSALPPSFTFKNRLMFERAFRNNHIYPFLGETHRSFSWLPISSSNTSSFWWSLSWIRLSLYVFLVIVCLYFYINSGWFFDQSPLVYLLWRVLDYFYLFIVQLQYIFVTILVSIIFYFSNFLTSTSFSLVRWMRKNHAEVVTATFPSKPHRPLDINVLHASELYLFMSNNSVLDRLDTQLSSNLSVNYLSQSNLLFAFPFLKSYFATLSLNSFAKQLPRFEVSPLSTSVSIFFSTNPPKTVQNNPFSLYNATPSRTIKLVSLDMLNSSVNLNWFSSFFKFEGLSRWLSLYSLNPSAAIRTSDLFNRDFYLKNKSALNWKTNREVLLQQANYFERIPTNFVKPYIYEKSPISLSSALAWTTHSSRLFLSNLLFGDFSPILSADVTFQLAPNITSVFELPTANLYNNFLTNRNSTSSTPLILTKRWL